jgi:hypothetical protein
MREMKREHVDRTEVLRTIICGQVLEDIMVITDISQRIRVDPGKVREIRLCKAIHIGMDIELPINPPIAVAVEGDRKDQIQSRPDTGSLSCVCYVFRRMPGTWLISNEPKRQNGVR